jgi:hypothetical protein
MSRKLRAPASYNFFCKSKIRVMAATRFDPLLTTTCQFELAIAVLKLDIRAQVVAYVVDANPSH